MGKTSESEIDQRVIDPDVRLMLMVRDDKAGAFEELVDKYHSRVVSVIYHMVGNVDEAEELSQEVFLRIYRKRYGYQPTAKFSTWLFTIVNNLALNAIRDRKRRPVQNLAAAGGNSSAQVPLEQLAVAQSGGTPSRLMAKSELADVVRAAVGQLSEDQRMAVILSKYEDLNYKQIGEIMNKSEMAVKSLLSRARNSLRLLLEPYIAQGIRPGGM